MRSRLQASGFPSTLAVDVLRCAMHNKLFYTISIYLHAPGVKVLSVVAPDQRDPAWSRTVDISTSNTVEKNPDEAFRSWHRSISFSDTSQFLIVSRASCDAMREKQPELVHAAIAIRGSFGFILEFQDWDVLRFRPNLIVEGCRPFEEDTWKRIRFAQSAM
jgi:hypothetical protein